MNTKNLSVTRKIETHDGKRHIVCEEDRGWVLTLCKQTIHRRDFLPTINGVTCQRCQTERAKLVSGRRFDDLYDSRFDATCKSGIRLIKTRSARRMIKSHKY